MFAYDHEGWSVQNHHSPFNNLLHCHGFPQLSENQAGKKKRKYQLQHMYTKSHSEALAWRGEHKHVENQNRGGDIVTQRNMKNPTPNSPNLPGQLQTFELWCIHKASRVSEARWKVQILTRTAERRPRTIELHNCDKTELGFLHRMKDAKIETKLSRIETKILQICLWGI